MIEVELQREDNLSKEDLMDRVAKRKIDVGNLMATQILIRAELEMRLCSGVRKKNKATYSLFDRRVPHSEKISKKDSLVKLASVYFVSNVCSALTFTPSPPSYYIYSGIQPVLDP